MRRVTLVAVVVSLLVAAPASAATLQPVGDFVSPTYLTSYPNDPDKLLVVERAGRVQLADHGAVSTFLDATALVGTIDGERGMWSIALAPDFATTGVLYVFYAGSATGGDLQLDEFTASGDAVDLSTRRPVLTIEHSERANHNGGQLQFGPDGYLYISTGDGDRRAVNAQDLTVLLGKILRIDPRESGGAPYSVPGDNPFVGVAGEDEIWSYGLRNPYRFSFDRATGALAIGDVGRQRSEEIDYDPGPDPGRGDNYGWPCFEGSLVGGESDHVLCANPQDLVFPIQEYSHDDGFCSVIGGYVVRDRSLGDLYGRYLDTDLCAGLVRSLIPAVPQAVDERSEGLAVVRPVSFGEDACGRLYVLSLDGPVSRLVGDAPADCRAGFARVIGDVLTVTAGAEVANRLEAFPSDSGAEWVVQDGAAPLDAGPSCVQARVNRVRCPQAAISRIAVDSTHLGDRVRTPVGLPATIDAGAGNDRAFTGDGADALKGGPGNDELDGGTGPDTIDGGADRDATTYATRGATEPVIVSLDGVADDGGALDGRDDNVLPNVENVIGGDGGDRLTGSAVRNALSGGAGNDVLEGGGGRDPLDGGDGRDTVLYGARGPAEPVEVSLDGLANDGGAVDGGRDNVLATVENVVGGDGADTLTGSAVRNALTGGGGADALHGLAGEDVIRANGDGSTDEIACGAGRDHAFADPADVFVDPPPDACELVN